MPGKQNDKVGDLTIRVLREIRDEVRGLRNDGKELQGEVTELRGEVTELRTEMHQGFIALRSEMHEGFDFLGRRIDNLLLGEHRQEHEELRGRVERIEQHLGLRSQ